jgi:hypothetical protein
LILPKFFIYQLIHKRIVLKRILKFTLKKAPKCSGATTIIRERIILTTVTLASSNNMLPDDGDCTEKS